MLTIANLFHALNTVFLDVAPAAALAVLAAAWLVRERKYRRKERELRGRIETYRKSARKKNCPEQESPEQFS